MQCSNNLKQLALGLHSYHDANKRFPAGWAVYTTISSFVAYYGAWPSSNDTYGSWVFPLMPYIEQGNLLQAYNAALAAAQASGNYDAVAGPNGAEARVIPTLLCPSDALPDPAIVQVFPPFPPYYPNGSFLGLGSYGANYGTQPWPNPPTPIPKDGMFNVNTRTRLTDVPDGSSNTILLGEKYAFDPLWQAFWPNQSTPDGHYLEWAWSRGGEWATTNMALVQINWRFPASFATNPPPYGSPAWIDAYTKRSAAYGSGHPGGCNIAFTDGSVHFVADTLDLITLKALSTRAGGEVIANY
jgi:prepilin-type processing-associated H-X9-DG protein